MTQHAFVAPTSDEGGTRNTPSPSPPLSHAARCLLLFVLAVPPAVPAQEAETLPQTKPLEWTEKDLSGRLMDGAHQFVERQITESLAKRGSLWARDFSTPDAYLKSVEPNREHFK